MFWVQSAFHCGWDTREVSSGAVRPERRVRAQLWGMLREVYRGGSYSALKVQKQTNDGRAPSSRTGRGQWVEEMGTEVRKLVKDRSPGPEES